MSGRMHRIALALPLFFGFGMAGPASAQTATQYPFCIQGIDNPGWSGCSFNSFQECEATASGTEAECFSNPWYKPSDSGRPLPNGSQSGAFGALPVGPRPNSGN
jgi:hypothetical protein